MARETATGPQRPSPGTTLSRPRASRSSSSTGSAAAAGWLEHLPHFGRTPPGDRARPARLRRQRAVVAIACAWRLIHDFCECTERERGAATRRSSRPRLETRIERLASQPCGPFVESSWPRSASPTSATAPDAPVSLTLTRTARCARNCVYDEWPGTRGRSPAPGSCATTPWSLRIVELAGRRLGNEPGPDAGSGSGLGVRRPGADAIGQWVTAPPRRRRPWPRTWPSRRG